MATPLEQQVGSKIAQLRRSAGLTLRELGQRTQLSDAYLSRVENGSTAITLANLAKLAEVFSITIQAFFENTPQEPKYVLCREGEGKRYRFRGVQGNLVHMLAFGRQQKLMEPLLVDVSSRSVPLVAHEGEEFNHVVEGSCTLVYGSENILLGPGDSIYFDASVPHRLQPESKKCRVLAVVTSKDYQFHTNVSRVLEPERFKTRKSKYKVGRNTT